MAKSIYKANRPLYAAKKYTIARIRPSKLVDNFASFLNSLKKEIDITRDIARKNLLFGKLGVDLQDRILVYNNLLTTRKELVDLGIRLE